jgi:hypothetical protein
MQTGFLENGKIPSPKLFGGGSVPKILKKKTKDLFIVQSQSWHLDFLSFFTYKNKVVCCKQQTHDARGAEQHHHNKYKIVSRGVTITTRIPA